MGATTSSRGWRSSRWRVGSAARFMSTRRRNRHYLNDRLESRGLAVGLRVGIALRDVRLEILDRDARRGRHVVLVVSADGEVVSGRYGPYRLARLLSRWPVRSDRE